MSLESEQDQQRVNEKIDTVKSLLENCRNGVEKCGNKLFVHTVSATKMGVPWETLGTSPEEVEGFLIQDLNNRVQELRSGNLPEVETNMTLILISSVLNANDDPIINQDRLREELMITQQEVEQMIETVDGMKY